MFGERSSFHKLAVQGSGLKVLNVDFSRARLPQNLFVFITHFLVFIRHFTQHVFSRCECVSVYRVHVRGIHIFHLVFSTDKEQCKYELRQFCFSVCLTNKSSECFFLAHSWWSYFKYAIWLFKLKSDCNFVWPIDSFVKIVLEEKWNTLIGLKLVNKIVGISTEISQQCIVFFWQNFTTICQVVIDMASKQAQTHYKTTCAVVENSTTPHLVLHRLTLSWVGKSDSGVKIQRQPSSR